MLDSIGYEIFHVPTSSLTPPANLCLCRFWSRHFIQSFKILNTKKKHSCHVTEKFWKQQEGGIMLMMDGCTKNILKEKSRNTLTWNVNYEYSLGKWKPMCVAQKAFRMLFIKVRRTHGMFRFSLWGAILAMSLITVAKSPLCSPIPESHRLNWLRVWDW